MVEEAEKYKAEDDANRHRVEAKNQLENYCYSMKSTLDDEKVASLVSDEEKAAAKTAIDETISWLDSNQSAEKEEFEEKQKELETTVKPIIGEATPPP